MPEEIIFNGRCRLAAMAGVITSLTPIDEKAYRIFIKGDKTYHAFISAEDADRIRRNYGGNPEGHEVTMYLGPDMIITAFGISSEKKENP